MPNTPPFMFLMVNVCRGNFELPCIHTISLSNHIVTITRYCDIDRHNATWKTWKIYVHLSFKSVIYLRYKLQTTANYSLWNLKEDSHNPFPVTHILLFYIFLNCSLQFWRFFIPMILKTKTSNPICCSI